MALTDLSQTEARGHFLATLAKVQEAYREWVNAGSAHIHREDMLFRSFGDLAEAGRAYRKFSGPLFAAGYHFADAWEKSAPAINDSLESGAIVPAELWRLWDALEAALLDSQKRNAPRLETLAELSSLTSKPTNAQIALMYGWTRADGSPDTDRVLEEMARPADQRAAVINPQQSRFDAEHADRTSVVVQFAQRRELRRQLATSAGPEDWTTLFRQGLSATQMALIKRCETQEVYRQASLLGFPPPPLHYGGGPVGSLDQPPPIAPADASPADDDSGLDAPETDPADVRENRIAEIKAYRQAGMSDAEIAPMVGLDSAKAVGEIAGSRRGRPAKATTA